MNQTVINIVTAESAGDYRLHLTFDDGTEQTVDFKPFLLRSQHPDIRRYLEPAIFSTYRVEYGELVWGDHDLSFPVIDLYENQLEHGPRKGIVA